MQCFEYSNDHMAENVLQHSVFPAQVHDICGRAAKGHPGEF